MIVDTTLLEREFSGRPIRVGMVGAGASFAEALWLEQNELWPCPEKGLDVLSCLPGPVGGRP
jgi:hypothetical protein